MRKKQTPALVSELLKLVSVLSDGDLTKLIDTARIMVGLNPKKKEK